MLEFLKVENPQSVNQLLKNFNPQLQTWIVSDLKSKQEIQNESIQRIGYYTDESILRASDFWALWLRRLDPVIQVVSSDFIRTLTLLFIDLYGEQLELSESDAVTLGQYVQELAPLLLHPTSESIIQEWIETSEKNKKWVLWYKKAKACIQFIVFEKKVIDKKWSAAYLQTIDLTSFTWPHEIIVDLGSELTSVEMGLFKILSQSGKVQIVTPSPVWKEKFPFLLKTYSENFGYGQEVSYSSSVSENQPLKLFAKVTTQLSEVKLAVSLIRKWLDQEKVKLEDIAVIAPDIEEYWTVLEFYLRQEGIPYKKETVVPMNSLGDIQSFLALLKNLTSEVSWNSLENSLYNFKNQPLIKFEQFKSLFYQLYDENDLARDQKIKELFFKKIDFKSELNREEFIAVLVRLWMQNSNTEASYNLFEVVVKDIFSQTLDTKLKMNRWVQFLKARISRKEIKIHAANKEGILVLPLMSAQMISATHRLYLGLYDEAFRKTKRSLLPLKDIEELKNQFDLAIQHPEESHLDFDLRWQYLSDCKVKIFTTPTLSFSSEPLTSALFFLENQPESPIHVPELTRLDEIQKMLKSKNAPLEQKFEMFDYASSAERLRFDLTGQNENIHSTVFKSLSVGEVENYSKCQFKLLASKGFRLRELPQVAIDLDPRQKGTFVHALFEYLIHKIQTNQYSLEDIQLFLETKRKELGLYQNEEIFWNIQKIKFLNLAEKFNAFESERSHLFKSQTETAFELYFDLKKKNFSQEKSEDSFVIKGRIDRVDFHKSKNYYLIYDYKSSVAQAFQHSKWLTEYQLQMFLYILAVENTIEDQSKVQGALYYLYKNFDTKKGLIESEVAQSDFDYTKRTGSLAEAEEIEKLKEDFIEFMSLIFENLTKGSFKTLPYKDTICNDCDWKRLCRAQHLM